MKLLLTSISLISFIILAAVDVEAQQVYKLNSIESMSKQVSAKTISGADHQRQYYTLHDREINFSNINAGDFIQMEPEKGSTSTFKVTRVERYTPNSISFLTQDAENPQNTFTFTYSEGQVHGIFHKSHEEAYFFEYDKSIEQNYVAESSSFYDDEQFCSVHEVNHDISTFTTSNSHSKSVGESVQPGNLPTTASMANSLDDEITIDVLVPYTANSKAWAESTSFSTIDNLIASAMANSQSALDNSQTGIKLRLVHYYQANYNFDDSDVDAGVHLRRLTRNDNNPFDLCPGNGSNICQESDYNGFFPDAHDLRNQYGADVVAAVLSEPNTGGIAWVNSSTAGSPFLAFSINRVQQIGTGYVLIHEIGHNMGNGHARNQSRSAATELGALFVYSTGNRFSTTDFNYATVMAYDDGGYTSIPYFSGPDIEYFGTSTGNPVTSNSEAGPADNARSMREIKRVIASYRPTIVNPPVANIDASSINADLDQQNNTATVPVTITNNGASDLMWDFDFDIASGIVTKSKTSSSKTIDSDSQIDAYSSSSTTEFMPANEPGVIFSTSFESSEGFSAGDTPARVGWRSFSTSAPFQITNNNPSDGTRHMRLPRRSEYSGSMFARSPFFGPQPMGEYIISFDIAIQDQAIDGNGEVFDVYVYDGSNSSISSGIIVSGGNLFARNINEQNEEVFSFTRSTFPGNGTYRSMEIHYNPNNQTIDYYMEGTLLASNPYTSGRKPDYMYFGQRNDVSGAYMDVDNISVERLYSPFNWLQTDSFGGVIAPDESETVNLTLNAVDVETGSYETVLLVRSNDPLNPVLEIPITADVQMATSSELSEEVPQRLELSQNYPNPFNPSTTIQFSLNRASDITLEVFNITGQRVATLVNETLSAGSHQHSFDASGLSSGIYIYRLRTPEQMLTRQMILIK